MEIQSTIFLKKLLSFILEKNEEKRDEFNYSAELICISGKTSSFIELLKQQDEKYFHFWKGSADYDANDRLINEFWRSMKDTRDDSDAFLVIENADLVCKSFMDKGEDIEFTRTLMGMMHSAKAIDGCFSNMYKSGWHVILIMSEDGDRSWYNADFCQYFSQKNLYMSFCIE